MGKLKSFLSIEDHGKLPEAERAYYVKLDNGAGYVPDADPVVIGNSRWAVEDVGGLKHALSSANSLGERLKGTLTAYEGLGTVDEVRTAVDFKKNHKPGTTEAEIKSITDQLTAKYEGEKKTLAQERDRLAADLQREVLEGTAVRAVAAKKGRAHMVLPHVLSQLKLVRDETGRSHVRVINRDGQVRLSEKPGSTSPMDVEELVETIRQNDDWRGAFDSDAKPGAGTPTGGTPAPGATKIPWNELSTRSFDHNLDLEKLASGEIQIT